MSSFEGRRWVALIPGAYYVQTRIEGPRALFYDAATSFIPACWILLRLSDVGVAQGIWQFLLGYVAFIAIYELGYLGNDLLDLKRPDGRQRCGFRTGGAYVLLFAMIRLSCWIAIAIATGWIENLIWISATGALVLVFAAHNLIAPPEPRIATFLQLALLRFTLPILATVPQASVPLVVILGLVFYVHLRFLAYLDSKALLRMPARKRPEFGLWQVILLLPLAGLISLAARSALPAELWLWSFALYLGWGLLGRRFANHAA